MESDSKKQSFKVQPNGNGFDIYQRQLNGRFKLVKSNLTDMKEVMNFQEEEIGRHLNRLNFLSMFKRK
jgi:hypothetical protein